MKNNIDLYKYFILFYVGFTTYITIEVLFRGYSFGLMGLVGGLCFLINDKINDRISWHIPLLWQGVIGSCVVTTFELIVGLLDKYWLHMNMWDYSMMTGNFMGVICLEFSFIWIFISIIGIILADAINYYLLEENGILPHYHIGNFIWYFPEKNQKKKK